MGCGPCIGRQQVRPGEVERPAQDHEQDPREYGGAEGAGPEERSGKRRRVGAFSLSFVLFLGSRTNIKRDLLLNFTV